MNSKFFRVLSIPLILFSLWFTPVSAQTEGDAITYSLVHLSDTQNLVSYPATYNYTFSYLESIKARYNISAIIITGDLVNHWNNEKEWETYSHAVEKTSIPIYTVAGNHDTNNGQNYHYYSQYTGNAVNSSVTTLNNFDLVEINSVFTSLKSQEYTTLRKTLLNSPNNFTIVATHYYMDENGTLSHLGKDIDHQLIIKPTIVLAGHVHADFVRVKMIGLYPVIGDLTNYQEGIPGGPSSGNISAGRIYFVTINNGQVEKISSETIWISPRHSFDDDQVLYDISVNEQAAEVTPVEEILPCNNNLGLHLATLSDQYAGFWSSLIEFFKGLFGG
jgi:DNA repair exonuclease SbcCD nuclease subunit